MNLATNDEVADLSVLGLSAEAVTVYRYLLRTPGAFPHTAATALDIDRDVLEQALTSLHQLQLVHLSPEQHLTTTDPAVGVERLIERRLAELSDASYRVAAARLAIPVLQREQRTAPPSQPPLDIETVVDLARTREHIEDLAFFARHEVCAIQSDGPLTPSMLEAARPLDLRCLRRGVTMRTIVLDAALEDDLTTAYLTELARLGAQVRVTKQAADRMLIYDRAVAVVPISPEATAQGAMIVRQPGLLAPFMKLFEQIWATADDISRVTEPIPPSPLSNVEKQVLNLLAAVDKDDVGARELGVSVRTYRRHVADLMLRLGATNRFQAALLAKGKGWL